VTNLLSRLCCCQNPEDDCGLITGLLPGSRGPAPGPTWAGCNGRPAPGQQWACEDSALDFPTVSCLVQDIKTCNVVGKEGTSHVFYSFGTDTKSARLNVRDKLNGKGTMFNDRLMSDGPKSGGWAEKVLYNPRFDIGDPTRVVDPTKNSYRMARNNIFVAQYSEALARACTGEVFFVYKDYQGGGGLNDGLGGIYKKPLDPDSRDPNTFIPNAWLNYEFPSLQRNSGVRIVTEVEQNQGYKRRTEWEPGPGYREVPGSIAMDLEFPPPAKSASARNRWADL